MDSDLFCCEMMARNATCETGALPADKTVFYSKRFDEYMIPHKDGISGICIAYCPWCGKKLPASKRERWFDGIATISFSSSTASAVSLCMSFSIYLFHFPVITSTKVQVFADGLLQDCALVIQKVLGMLDDYAGYSTVDSLEGV